MFKEIQVATAFSQPKSWTGVNFIIRLKETAMPLDTILHYSKLRALGESTITARKKLLEEHRRKLQSQIENQLQHLNALETKIDFYKAIEVS